MFNKYSTKSALDASSIVILDENDVIHMILEII